MLFSIKWVSVRVIAKLCTVFQTRVITKTKQLGKSHEFCGGRRCFSYCSWPPIQQKNRLLIGLNCILLCLNNSGQIAKLLFVKRKIWKTKVAPAPHLKVSLKAWKKDDFRVTWKILLLVMRIGIKLPWAATYYHYDLAALFETFRHIDEMTWWNFGHTLTLSKDWLFFHLLYLLLLRKWNTIVNWAC